MTRALEARLTRLEAKGNQETKFAVLTGTDENDPADWSVARLEAALPADLCVVAEADRDKAEVPLCRQPSLNR